MKKTGEFKIDRLETKKEWIDYAKELESLLLLRPQPYYGGFKQTQEEWDAEYGRWYSQVVEFWR